MPSTVCPGCGLRLLETQYPAPDGFRASVACWSLYGEAAADTLTRGDPAFVHQHLVDAWGAQHSGPESSPIMTAFALVGLYLATECGFTGREVQRAHMRLAAEKRPWPHWPPPRVPAALTVQDVLQAPAGPQRDQPLLQWSAAVWATWPHAQAEIRKICAPLLGTGIPRA